MRRSLAAIPLAVALSLPWGTLKAQDPALRTRIDAWRDTLTALATPAEVRNALAASPPEKDGVGLLRDGFAQLRLSAWNHDRGALDQAWDRFGRSTLADPDWAYAWYGRARTALSLADLGAFAKETPWHPLGVSYLEDGVDALERSLALDLRLPPADSLLADELMSPNTAMADRFRGTIEALATDPGGDARFALILARLHRDDGALEAALRALDDYAARGGDSGAADLERARILAALGRRDEAAAAYLAGAERAGPLGQALYRADLALIAEPGELPGLTSAGSFGAGVGFFWARRDAAELRPPGERLAEHLRRWNYAEAHFHLAGFVRPRAGEMPFSAHDPFGDAAGQDRIPFVNAFRDTLLDAAVAASELDHRGLMYLRHGAPDQIARSDYPYPGANESWLYRTPQGPLVLTFLGTIAPEWLGDLPPDLWESRGVLGTQYFRLAVHREQALLASPVDRENTLLYWSQQEAQRERMDRQRAAATDGYPRHFGSKLSAAVQFLAVGGGPHGLGRLLVPWSVPVDQLVPREEGGSAVYTLHFEITAVDPARATVVRWDSTRTFAAPAPLSPSAKLAGFLDLPLPDGRFTVRALVQQPGSDAAAAFGRDTIPIGAPSGALALSDVVPGLPGGATTWQGPWGPVALNPLGAFPAGGRMALYYELGGLVPGRSYRTALELRPLHGGAGANRVALTSDETASTPATQVTREVELGHLPPGQYRLRLTVEDRITHSSVASEQVLSITEH